MLCSFTFKKIVEFSLNFEMWYGVYERQSVGIAGCQAKMVATLNIATLSL